MAVPPGKHFKALLGKEPQKEGCLQYFAEHQEAFLKAASAKISSLKLPTDRSLHINSRDLRRAMTADPIEGAARACRVLDRR